MKSALDLSVVVPALHEGPNLAILLPQLRNTLDALKIAFEVLIVTRDADPETREAAARIGALVVEQSERGYGGALLSGFERATGTYVLTMDADLSHQPTFIRDLWIRRRTAEVVIASRYVAGGSARMPLNRKILSRVLNAIFARGLSLPVSHLSSGFRLYRRDSLEHVKLEARDFDILPEILIRIYAEGWKVRGCPGPC